MFNKSRWPKKSPLAVIRTNVTKVDKGRYVFSSGGGGGALGPQRGGSSVKVSTKRGGSYLFVSYSRGRPYAFSRFL